MSPETRQRIVLVQADFSDGESSLGTGFRLAPKLTLTSHHVVHHPVRTSELATKIRVALDSLGDGQVEKGSAEPIWFWQGPVDAEDPEVLDAVLLADELPAGDVQPFTKLIAEGQSSARWISAGYPVASSNLPRYRPDELRGDVSALKRHEVELELTVDRDAPRPRSGTEEPHWRGLSGAALFLLGDSPADRLYGVIRRSPEEYPKTISAVSMPALLRDESFAKHLVDAGCLPRATEASSRHAEIVSRLRTLLFSEGRLREKLARFDESWRQADEERGLDGLLEAMQTGGDFENVVDGLRELGRGSESFQGPRFTEVAALVVALVGGRVIECLAHGKGAAGIKLQVAGRHFAEVGLAHRDGRQVRFVGVEKAAPRALLEAPLSAVEAGFGKQQWQDDQLTVLEDRFLFEDSEGFPEALEGELKNLERLPLERRRRRRRKQLALKIRNIVKEYGAAPYVIADQVFYDAMPEHGELFLEHLAKKLPELRQVELCGDPDDEDEETYQLVPFWRLVGLFPSEEST